MVKKEKGHFSHQFSCKIQVQRYSRVFCGKIFLNAIHYHKVTKTRRKIIIKKIFCVFVVKTPTRSKSTRYFYLDLGTIFVTKTDHFCQKATNNFEALFVISI